MLNLECCLFVVNYIESSEGYSGPVCEEEKDDCRDGRQVIFFSNYFAGYIDMKREISIRKCSKTFFVGFRAEKPAKRVQKPCKKGPGPSWQVFFALDPTEKVFEHFLIDILCCLHILNKMSKIEEKKHTVTLVILWNIKFECWYTPCSNERCCN